MEKTTDKLKIVIFIFYYDLCTMEHYIFLVTGKKVPVKKVLVPKLPIKNYSEKKYPGSKVHEL